MPADTPTPTIRLIRPPALWEASLERASSETEQNGPGPDAPSPIEFEVGFGRPALYDIDVLLTVRVNDVPGAKLRVSCIASFRLEPVSDEPAETEAHLRTVATRTAPSVIYPFIREMMAAMAQRAGLRPVTLPIINFQTFFPIEKAEIPAFEHSASDQSEVGNT